MMMILVSTEVNPIRAGGGAALFSDGYFSIKKGSGGPKFHDFS